MNQDLSAPFVMIVGFFGTDRFIETNYRTLKELMADVELAKQNVKACSIVLTDEVYSCIVYWDRNSPTDPWVKS